VRIAALIATAAHNAAAAMLALIATINIGNVVGRYIFAKPIEPAEELMLFLMVGAVFLSFVKVTQDDAHIRMDMLRSAMPLAVRRGFEVFADIVSIGVAMTVVLVGTPLVIKLAEFRQTSDAAGILMAIPEAVIPVGFGLAALVIAIRLMSGAQRRNRGD
jgi:TRAP-type C4-dicarboxylate transport system permease small subunit